MLHPRYQALAGRTQPRDGNDNTTGSSRGNRNDGSSDNTSGKDHCIYKKKNE